MSGPAFKNRFGLFALLLLGLLPLPSPGLGREAVFDRYAARQGLSSSSVNAVVQDGHGFLWLATEDGLLRYDGYAFTTFPPPPGAMRSPEPEGIDSVCAGRGECLWAVTSQNRLLRFDTRRERWDSIGPFTSGATGSAWPVTAVREDRWGRVWTGVLHRGVCWWDPVTRRSGCYRLVAELPGKPLSVTALCPGRDGAIWAGTAHHGLFRIDPVSGVVGRHFHRPGTGDVLSHCAVACLAEGAPGELWVGTLGGGVLHFRPEGNVERDPADEADVFALALDRQGRVWMGTNRGLRRFNPADGRTAVFRSDPRDPLGLSSNTIISLFGDRSGNLWIGTQGNGLCRFDPHRIAFSLLQNDPHDPSSLGGNDVQSLCEGEAGTLWIGTMGGGLNRWDRVSGRIERLAPDRPGALPGTSNTVLAMARDRRGVLWFGTLSGKLGQVEPGSRQPRLVHDFSTEGRREYAYTFLEDPAGAMWVGVNPGFLARFDADGRLLARHRLDAWARLRTFALAWADSRNLWLATSAGLLLFDTVRGKPVDRSGPLAAPACLAGKAVRCLRRSATGDLWAGAEDGLYRCRAAASGFAPPSPEAGLRGLLVKGILEDGRGDLWMLAAGGIVHADGNGRPVRNYTVLDGLQSDVFRDHAFLMTGDGEAYAGGINGLNGFVPGSVQEDREAAPMALTGLQLFYQPVKPADGAGAILPAVVADVDTVELNHEQNVLTFEFSLLGFGNPDQFRYTCRMEGFDKDWVPLGTRRLVTYTNLDPGEYVFRVRGAAENGVWNEKGVSLRVRIHAPFYRTGWFLALAALALVATGGLGFVLGARFLSWLAERHNRVRFGRFRLLERLGAGATGEVFRAREDGTGRIGALKVIHGGVLAPELKDSFLREGLVCEAVSHPNAVRVFGRGSERGRSFLFREYVDGPSLRSVLEGPPLPLKTSLAITSALVDIVSDLHAAGVLHRDLKPENILFTAGFRPYGPDPFDACVQEAKAHLRILDFGLSRFIERKTLTRLDLDAGTPLFLPPETFWSRLPPEPSVDYYALGVILYLMVVREAPYETDPEDMYQTVFRIVHDEAVPPVERVPELPGPVSDFILAMIRKDPAARLSRPEDIRRALAELRPSCLSAELRRTPGPGGPVTGSVSP